MQELKDTILFHLFGPPQDLLLLPVPAHGGRAVEGLVSDVYDAGLVSNRIDHADGIVELRVWIHEHALARLLAHSQHRIEVK